MADWFETHLREPAGGAPVDPAFAARVRALVVEEWQADDRDIRSDGTESQFDQGDIIMLDTEERRTTTPERPSPRRRWPLVAAAAAVVAVVAVAAVALDDDEREVDTAGESSAGSTPRANPAAVAMPYGEEDFPEVGPGTYFLDPDEDPATPLRVEYELAHEGWSAWPGAVKFDDRGAHVALSIVMVENLSTNACDNHRPADPPVGPTVDDLATALAGLSPFELTSPPRPVTRYGYSGVHLQWTVPDIPVRGEDFTNCQNGNLQTWIAPGLQGAFYGYNAEPGRTEDFWILDVDGTRLVLSSMAGPSAPEQDVQELEEILDSVRIVP